jgi:hypothetical protein
VLRGGSRSHCESSDVNDEQYSGSEARVELALGSTRGRFRNRLSFSCHSWQLLRRGLWPFACGSCRCTPVFTECGLMWCGLMWCGLMWCGLMWRQGELGSFFGAGTMRRSRVLVSAALVAAAAGFPLGRSAAEIDLTLRHRSGEPSHLGLLAPAHLAATSQFRKTAATHELQLSEPLMTALVRGSGTTLYDNSEAEHIEGNRLHGNSENTAQRLQSTRNTVAAGSMCSTGLSEVPCARSVSIRWINLDDKEDRASHMRAMFNASQATDTGEVIRSAQRFRAVMATCEACNRDQDGSGCVQVVGACGSCNVSSYSSFSDNFTNAHESNWNRGDAHRHQFVGVWSSHTSALHNVCHTLLERTCGGV